MAITDGSLAGTAERSTLRDLVSLVRLPSVVAGAVEVLLGAFLATGHVLVQSGLVFAGPTSMAFCVAGAMSFNDVADRKLDATAKPGRPLPSGRRTIRWAAVIVASCVVGALASAVMLGRVPLVMCLLLLAVSAAYSVALKRVAVLGNLTVAACSAVPVVFGARVVSPAVPARVWAAAGLVVLFMFAYEVLKTIEDAAGDRAGGVRTVAVIFGPRGAALVLSVSILLLVVGVAGAAELSSHRVVYGVLAVGFALSAGIAALPLVVAGRQPRPAIVNRSVFVMRGAWMLGLFTLWFLR